MQSRCALAVLLGVSALHASALKGKRCLLGSSAAFHHNSILCQSEDEFFEVPVLGLCGRHKKILSPPLFLSWVWPTGLKPWQSWSISPVYWLLLVIVTLSLHHLLFNPALFALFFSPLISLWTFLGWIIAQWLIFISPSIVKIFRKRMCLLYNLCFLYGIYRVQMVVINNASQNGLLFDKGTFILICGIYGTLGSVLQCVL